MIGSVDQKGRAVLTLNVKANETANPVSLTVWVETAFDGELVFSKSLIRQFALLQSAAIEATLADGQTVVLETYSCLIDWFGDWRIVEVIANDGRLPLLGVGLLNGRDLHINYRTNELTLD